VSNSHPSGLWEFGHVLTDSRSAILSPRIESLIWGDFFGNRATAGNPIRLPLRVAGGIPYITILFQTFLHLLKKYIPSKVKKYCDRSPISNRGVELCNRNHTEKPIAIPPTTDFSVNSQDSPFFFQSVLSRRTIGLKNLGNFPNSIHFQTFSY
jgi:hypothetical protein